MQQLLKSDRHRSVVLVALRDYLMILEAEADFDNAEMSDQADAMADVVALSEVLDSLGACNATQRQQVDTSDIDLDSTELTTVFLHCDRDKHDDDRHNWV